MCVFRFLWIQVLCLSHIVFNVISSLQNSLAGMIRFVEDSARLRSEWATTLSTGMCESMSNLADELKKQKNQVWHCMFYEMVI